MKYRFEECVPGHDPCPPLLSISGTANRIPPLEEENGRRGHPLETPTVVQAGGIGRLSQECLGVSGDSLAAYQTQKKLRKAGCGRPYWLA